MSKSLRKTAMVTGSTGVIGPVLIHHLLNHGYSVRALDLIPPHGNLLPGEVSFYTCDLADVLGLREATTGCDIVFHLAARLHVTNPSLGEKKEYWKVNVEGTRNLLEAATKARVQRLIFFSTINVYNSNEPRITHDESSPIRPDSWYAESKAEAENIVINGIPSVVLRLAAVYGPRMKGNYLRLLQALHQRHFFMIGDGQNRRTLVHLLDLCKAALLVAEHPNAVGRIYNVTDGQVHTLREVVVAMCKALGKKPPRFALPSGLARLAFAILEDGFRLLGRKSPLGRWTVDKLIENLAVSGDRIQQEVGFRPQVDLLWGWHDVVRQMTGEN